MDGGIIGFRRAQARQETNRRNALSVAAKPYVLSGQVLINGAGDVLAAIPFPYQFIEKPILSQGWDMEHGQEVTIGNLPRLNMGVSRWDITGTPPAQLFYQGATLSISVDGPVDVVMYAHYTFTGVALVNPISSSASVEQSI